MNPFLARYKELLGNEFSALQKVQSRTLHQAIRVNTLKIGEKKLMDRLKKEGILLEKIPFLTCGYFVKKSKQSIGAMPEHLLGYYYIQETAAQIPVEILKPTKKDIVLDVSAAPGGKTTQIAQHMENKGVLLAMDSNAQRIASLKNNLERLGIANCLVYVKDGRYLEDVHLTFDKILLDAPCSGNFAVDKEWFSKKTLTGIKERAALQKEMLRSAISVLKQHGTLVYSTCSLEPEENESVIDWALKNIEGIEMEKIDLPVGDPGLTQPFGTQLDERVTYCKRFWPHKTNTQGFFIAKIKKK